MTDQNNTEQDNIEETEASVGLGDLVDIFRGSPTPVTSAREGLAEGWNTVGSARYLLQPAQPGNGMAYDANQPLPYPIHLNEDLFVARETLPGIPMGHRLIGFQNGAEQTLVVQADEFIENPARGVGRVPVFMGDGQIYHLTEMIARVSLEVPTSFRVWNTPVGLPGPEAGEGVEE